MFSTVCYAHIHIYVVWKLPQVKVLKRPALIIENNTGSFKFCKKNLLELNVIEQREVINSHFKVINSHSHS